MLDIYHQIECITALAMKVNYYIVELGHVQLVRFVTSRILLITSHYIARVIQVSLMYFYLYAILLL